MSAVWKIQLPLCTDRKHKAFNNYRADHKWNDELNCDNDRTDQDCFINFIALYTCNKFIVSKLYTLSNDWNLKKKVF